MTRRKRWPWQRSLGVRLALVVGVGFLALAFVGDRIIGRFEGALYPEWYDADFLEGRAAAVRLAEEGKWTWQKVNEAYPETFESVVYPRYLLFTLLLSAGLAIAVTWWGTRRLRRLANQAEKVSSAVSLAESESNPSLPSFEAGGHDEIAQLAEALNAMQVRTEDLLEQLQARDQWRRQWTAQIAHDLRTPLAALSACLDRARNDPDVDVGAALQLAEQDTARVMELTEDLLEGAKLQLRTEVAKEPVPLGELLHDAAQLLQPLADQKQIELRCELPAGLPVVQADGRLLSRAMENLLRNAIRHADSIVQVHADSWMVTVQNDGEVIPGLSSRWQPLHEWALSLQRAGALGLGLEIVQRIVELHGGSAEVRAAVGHDQPSPAAEPGGGAEVRLNLTRLADFEDASSDQ